MLKIKRLSAWVCVISVGLALLSSAFVYGAWVYYQDTVPVGYGVSHQLGEFGYAPEEVVPGGEHEATLGENHLKLIDLILNEKDKGYGMNININVLIHQYLRTKPVLYSNQKISGGHLKHILDPKNNTHRLYYCIEKVSDTLYYCYTFSVDDLIAAENTEQEILAYRTMLEKTDIWRATKSYVGYAKVRALSYLGASADSQSESCSIDISTWHV